VDYLAVATIGEAVTLREAGIRSKIFLLSAPPKSNLNDVLDLDIIPVITDKETAVSLNALAGERRKKRSILLAVETGMGRLGFQANDEDLTDIWDISTLENIEILALFSHLAAADSLDEDDVIFTYSQISSFEDWAQKLNNLGIFPKKKTLANSAGILYYKEAHFDIVRPGIALYGEYPSEDVVSKDTPAEKLAPVMSVKSKFSYIRKVPENYTVSYGHNFITTKPSIIGTLPLGYADGLPRYFGAGLRVLVNGVTCPIVGNVCMDQCMVDLTELGDDVLGKDVVAVILGQSGDEIITANEIAEKTNTINYEVLTRFGQRLGKVYV
jgi:alanine racemase